MVNRPRATGTRGEAAVVHFLRANGFGGAERRALHGALDQGDIVGVPGVVIEVKAGAAAKGASDGLVARWVAETEVERANARAEIGILVLARAGIGAVNAGRWWAVLPIGVLACLDNQHEPGAYQRHGETARLHLGAVLTLLRGAGYGDAATDAETRHERHT